MLFTKAKHEELSQFLFPVSTLYAKNAWNHDPPFGEKGKSLRL